MSVGFPIDVTRLLGDNQRFQRDLAHSQQFAHQLRAQLDQALASNEALRAQNQQLQRQKQGEFNNFIAAHQELYEKELTALRLERQQLIAKVQELGNTKPDPHLQETIQELTRQIERHEAEKTSIKGDLIKVKQLMVAQQEEIHRKLNEQIRQKQLKIKELQSVNADLKDCEQQLRDQVKREKLQRVVLEENYNRLKQQYQRLESNWNSLAEKSSVAILTELIQLRNQNLNMQKQANSAQLATFSNDQEVYTLIQKLHEELALLRYELTESRNACSQLQISFQNERGQFRNEKAQKELQVLKLQKEVNFMKQQEQEHRLKLQQLEQRLAVHIDDTQTREKTDQEIALLKIKVFVLESLRGSQKYRREDDTDYSKYQAQFESFGAFKFKNNRIEVLQNVAAMHVAMTETQQQLKQEQSKRKEASRKYKQYKQKWELLSKRQGETGKALELSRKKQGEYQRLFEKMQGELQKAYLVSVEANQRQNANGLISAYQQKLQIANQEISTLQAQLRESSANNHLERLTLEKEIQKLSALYKQNEQTCNQLLQKNRSLQNKILEQSLSAATSKVGKNFQAQLAEKTAALILSEQELQNLREQLASFREANQQQTATISRLEQEVSRLNHQVSSPATFQYQLNYLQQKLAYLQGVLGEQRNASNANNDNHIRTLYEQIAKLKTQTQQTKHDYLDKSDRAHAESEIESYRGRLLQLQQALRGIANENEQKSLQIFRLNEENHLLSKQLDKIQEELDVLRGKAGSMREIDLIDRNKQLEDQIQEVKKELARTVQALHARQAETNAVRKQCQEYWSDNLKLLVVIKQNNVQLKENKFLSEKYDQEITHRQQQFQARIHSLQNQNEILKNLVEDLRKSIIDRQSAKQHQDSSNKTDLEELRKELEGKERENFYFQQELNRLLEERMKEKDSFDRQWNKLLKELNELRQQLEQERRKIPSPNKYARPEDQDDSRVHIITSQNGDQTILNNLRATISTLQAQLADKNQHIFQLQSELSEFQLSLKRSGFYSQQVIELRNQVHALMEGRFALEDKIRVLEQQNSLLKIRRISEKLEPRSEVFSQQTFGPSMGTQHLIEQLRDPQEEAVNPNLGQLRSWADRYEQTLCLLVISFAEIDSLRKENETLQEKHNRQAREYTERLRHIEDSIKTHDSTVADLNLVRELECGHRHLVELTHLGLKEGSVGLAQLGSFTESITGGKMIESYSVREEDESLTSQEIIHM